jgi:hypothetical protein
MLLIKVLSMSGEAPVPSEGGGVVVASLQQRGLAAGRSADSDERYSENDRGREHRLQEGRRCGDPHL